MSDTDVGVNHAAGIDPWKFGGLTWLELGRRVVRESQRDEILGRAAQLAFYFLFALFPALLFLTALIGLFPLDAIMPELLASLHSVLPEDALSLVERVLEQVVAGSGADLLSLGLLGALWASSSGITAIVDALNAVYHAEERRSFWTLRLIGMVMTIGLAWLVIMAVTLVLYGEHLGRWIAAFLELGEVFVILWIGLRWLVVMTVMLVAVAVIYYVCPAVTQDWKWITPGSVFAVGMWVLVSLAFKLYVDNFGDYNKAYGSIAGVIVLMLWFYLSGLVLLLGGEINAEIGKAAAQHGAAAGDPAHQAGRKSVMP